MWQAAYLAAELCQGFSNPEGTLGKLLILEDTHRAVPDDGLGVCQGPLEGLQGVRANVQTLQQDTPSISSPMHMCTRVRVCKYQAMYTVLYRTQGHDADAQSLA